MHTENKVLPISLPAAEEKGKAEENTDEGGGTRKLLMIYRTASRNHVALSAIADRKANFLLSVTTILCSVTFTFLIAKSDDQPLYILPGIFLIGVCTITIILAVLSTTPTIGTGLFTREQVKKRKANLLFFGHYYKVEPEEYQWAMGKLLDDRKYLKETISYDLYHLGVVAARKFRYLRVGYTIFMVGTVLTIILAFLAFQYQLAWPWHTELFSNEK